MYYYEVMPIGGRVILDRSLVYRYNERLCPGQAVRVPLRNRQVNAVVLQSSSSSRIPSGVKDIVAIANDIVVPPTLLRLAPIVADYYAAPLSSVYALLVPKNAHLKRRRMTTDSESGAPRAWPILSEDQRQALETIWSVPASQTILLRGETASGKTRIYRELISKTLSQHHSALLLVPEIGLTAQVVQSLSGLSDNVFVVHSTLSETERQALWLKIRQQPSSVVVGPRSALFYPLNNLKTIIIDEAHDSSYRQDNTPKYSALRVAKMLANISHAKLLLASATPSVEDYYYATHEKSKIIEIARPVAVLGNHRRNIEIVDMTTASMAAPYLSRDLTRSIAETLRNHRQVLIFHNRRGTSSAVVCQKCGYLNLCPVCHHPLTHHSDTASLLCHICGRRQPVLISCPQCASSDLIYRGFGTKKLEDELTALFPTARIARFDSDNKNTEKLESRYQQLHEGQIDIIIGTQIIAKGLDLPLLELVAIPSVESLLFLPDYSAGERFFQLIYQAMGRVGRHSDGCIIIQAYSTDSHLLRDALRRDYQLFYRSELESRRRFGYPPFRFILKLTVEKKQPEKTAREADRWYAELRKSYPRLVFLGPAPAYFERSPKGYRWQIVVKAASRQPLAQIARSLPRDWSADLDPPSLI